MSAPVNDNFADAQLLTGSSIVQAGSNVDATVESGEPPLNSTTKSIWYKWIPPATGVVSINTTGSSFSCGFNIYTGSVVGTLTAVPNVTVSPRRFWANANIIYYIQMGGFGSTSGATVLNITLTASGLTVDRHLITTSSVSSSPIPKAFVSDSNGYFYIGVIGNVYKSTDSGRTWASIGFCDHPWGAFTSGTVHMVIDSQDNLHIFFPQTITGRIIYYYSKMDADTLIWTTPVEMSVSSTITFASNSMMLIDTNDNIYLIYVRSHETNDVVYDIYYRKQTTTTLEAEINITNYTLSGFDSDKTAERLTGVCDKNNNIYIMYRFYHRVGSPSFSITKSLNILKNFTDITTVYTFTESTDFNLINATQDWHNAIIDESNIVHVIYRKGFLDGATLKTQVFYTTSEDFLTSIHLSDLLDTDMFNATFISGGNIVLQKNSDEELYLFVGITNGSSSEIKYMKKSSPSSAWVELALLYSLPSTGRAVKMAHWNTIPVVGGISHNFISSGFSFFEESSLYYVVSSSINEETLNSLCPYVEGGQARKMVTSVTGLDHLNGAVVQAQMDGVVPGINSFTVSGGSITLPEKAAVAHVGLPYDGTIKILKASEGSIFGTGQTKKRRIFLSVLELYRTLGLKIGLDENHLDPIFDSEPALPLFIGEHDKLPNTSWDEEAELIIRQDKPLPAHILALVNRSEVEEGI